MAGENVKIITDANFEEEVLKSPIPVVVDFWAQWCGPCKMFAPIFQEVAGEYNGRVSFGKVDIDQNTVQASRYGITSVPTVLFFKNGSVVDQQIGLLAKPAFKSRIEKLLS